MNKNEKRFALTATFILLSLTFLPAVQSENTSEKSEELQEITFEIHTLTGVKEITKKLSTSQVERLSVLTEELQNNLQTLQEPTATIVAQSEADNSINTILAELKDYGLLGDYSTKGVKDLLTGEYLKQINISKILKKIELKIDEIIDKIQIRYSTRNIRFGGFNLLCKTYVKGRWIINIHPWNFITWLSAAMEIGDHFFALLLDHILHPTSLGFWIIHSPEDVDTLGLLGHGRSNSYYPGAAAVIMFTLGFTGVVIGRFQGISPVAFPDTAIGFSLLTNWYWCMNTL